MAATVLTDIDFNSSTWKDVVAGEFTQRLGFLTGGALVEAPDNMIGGNDKGYTTTFTAWDTLTGDADTITGSYTTTVNSFGTWKDICVWTEKEKAWGQEQIVNVVTGNDGMNEVARQIAEYVAGQVHAQAMSVLSGVFSVELGTTHSTGTDYTGSTIDGAGVLAAKLKLGDNQDMLKIALMNSKVHNDAVANGTITSQIQGVSNEMFRSGNLGSLYGMIPVQTDKLTATSSVYPSYFCAPGAMVYKLRPRSASSQTNGNLTQISVNGFNIELERHRVALTNGGQDVLIVRWSSTAHVLGVQYDGSGTATNPTNAQLATAANWTKVAPDDKLIRIVELKTL